MRCFKRLLPFVLVLLLLSAGFTTTAFADDTGQITINAPNSLSLVGQTFNAYQIFSFTYSPATDGYSYTLHTDFDSFANYPNNSSQSLKDYIETNPGASEMQKLVADLWTYIKAQNITPTAYTNSAGVTSATIGNLPLGYYLITGSGTAEGGAEVIAANALVSTAYTASGFSGVVNLKADAPSIDKKVSKDNGGTYGDYTDVKIGDTVTFQITSKVPETNGYASYVFTVHDTMSDGLTYTAGSVNVLIGSSAFTDYTIVTDEPGHTLCIKFDPDEFASQAAGSDIVITYEAMLNENALIGPSDINSNTVYLEYSNDPYTLGATENTPEDTVKVYTFELNIFKYTMINANKSPLSEAKFELRTTEDDPNSSIKFTETAEGVYRVATASDQSPSAELISPGSGNIKLTGLEVGTYYLVETQPPAGFNPLDSAQEIKINNNGNETYTIPSVIEIENVTGFLFPGTGGVGRTIFVVGGLILMGGAAVGVFVTMRKSSARNATLQR